ncbi:hypothetical protein D9619_003830 [Psilocybe cf. subviscida]|uniref:Ricin B lectin domain-containing protein n=1 Tax=Psilocybe cf. subviscida TaxID=2480587 RepID=A0A8H5EUK2_9AGAR|nr:hypothetical protein D9619_003830 [Psilocybe cf. subviscida]
MMFANLLRFVVTASALTVAYGQVLANGNYQIKNVQEGTFALNFNGMGNPTTITFHNLSSVEASEFTWHVAKDDGDSGFTLTNVGSGNTAAVTTQEVGAQVNGLVNTATQFAIEPAGNGNFVIKSPNADLLWAVFEDRTFQFVPFLEPASGGDEEKFQFIAV